MPTNPYFNHFYNNSEKDLLHDLIIESIQNYGIELWYIKKDVLNPDLYDALLGETPGADYQVARKIEGYVKDFDGYQGEGHLATKFGMEIRNQLTFSLSIRRWQQEAIDGREERPFEGDIIFFPLSKEWFEIKFVQDASIFYQVGEFAIYDCICEQFDYSHERVTIDTPTGEEFIDNFEDNFAYSVTLDMDTSGSALDYVYNEMVYQGTSVIEPEASARVSSWDRATGKLKLKQLFGKFTPNVTVIGDQSGTELTYILPEVNSYLRKSSKTHGGVILLSDGFTLALSKTETKKKEQNLISNTNLASDNEELFVSAENLIVKRRNPFLK